VIDTSRTARLMAPNSIHPAVRFFFHTGRMQFCD